MKIYTAKYDANRPTLKQINIPNFSDAKIGIEVVKNGEKLELDESNVVMKSGDTTISADGVYDDFVTVPVSTGDCGDDNLYKVEIDKPRAYDKEDVVLSNLNPGSRHSMTTTLTLQTTDDLDGFLASISDIPLKPENFECTTVDKTTELIYYHPSRFAFFYTTTKPLWYVKNRGTPAQAIWKWYNSITKEYKDDIVYPTDFAETIISYGFYGSGYQDTETGTTTIKIGEPFSDNFKLVINSAKSSVLDAETSGSEPVEETDPIFTAWKDGLVVAAGKDAFATGENTTAVGPYAVASGNDSLAVGYEAAATANGAVQIGQGSNAEINTVKIKDYTILDANGKIPAERLPGTSLTPVTITLDPETILEDIYLLTVEPNKDYTLNIIPKDIGISWMILVEPNHNTKFKPGDKVRIHYTGSAIPGDTVGINFADSQGITTYCLADKYAAGGSPFEVSWNINEHFWFELEYIGSDTPDASYPMFLVKGGSYWGTF